MPDRTEAVLRHALYYLRQLVAVNDGYLAGNDAMLSALAQFDQDWASIAIAQKRLAQWVDNVSPESLNTNRDSQTLVDFCNAYPDAGIYVLSMRLPPQVRLEWLQSALKASRLLGNNLTTQAHLGNIGLVYLELGQVHLAMEHLEQALGLAESIGDVLHQGIWAGNLGNALATQGQHEKALQHHLRHLDLARKQGDLRSQGHALANLGASYAALGQYQETLQVYQQHLALSRQTGDKRDESHALFSLGEVYFDLGDLAQAEEFFRQSLEIADRLQEYPLKALALGGLSDVLTDRGNPASAIEQLTQALKCLQESPDSRVESRLLASMGNACNAADRLDEALTWHQRLRDLALSTSNQSLLVHALGGQVSVYRVKGDFSQARALAAEGLSLAEEMGFVSHIAFLSWQIGLILDAEGSPQDALKMMERTIAYERQVKSPELQGHLTRMAETRQKVA